MDVCVCIHISPKAKIRLNVSAIEAFILKEEKCSLLLQSLIILADLAKVFSKRKNTKHDI